MESKREESDCSKVIPEISISIAIPVIKQYTTRAKVSATALRKRESVENIVITSQIGGKSVNRLNMHSYYWWYVSIFCWFMGYYLVFCFYCSLHDCFV
ncbi:hypothetical protein [Yersinia entomophaga]|uniref:hypothetical protein n=1 Tax=Yersinia entomophaga TaxID=935293 RepID=UPI00211B35B3|nr:hypothetical protein [Yersinia entomophaga]